MLLRFWILYLVLIKIHFAATSLTVVNCIYDQQNVTNLTAGEYVRFQTMNYPEKLNACGAKFVRSDGKENIWFVFLHGSMEYFSLTGISVNGSEFETTEYFWKTIPSWFSELSSYPQLEFHTTDLIYTMYRGFQAFIYAPNINELSLCPLSTMKTFILDTNLDIIPITSNFNNLLKLSPQTCTWNFQIPLEFKLKIHVKSLNLHYPSVLTITSDTNKTTIQSTNVGIKYFTGSNFTIFFDTKKNIVGSLDFFAAIISAVHINPIMEESNCFQAVASNNDSKTIIFGNYNESLGYENNEVCQLIIPSNFSKTAFFLSWQGYLEAGVDTLTLEDKSSGEMYDITQNMNWTILNPSNLTMLEINFQSDGNVIYPGFLLNLTTKTSICECSNHSQTFSCDTFLYNFPALLNDENCDINCSYTITSDKKCGNYSSLLIPKIYLPQNSTDTVTIYEKNNLIAVFNSENSATKKHYLLNPDSDITIDLQSNSVTSGGVAMIPTPSITFGIANLNASHVVTNLTPENFTYSIDANFMDRTLLTVIAPENYTLDFYLFKVYHDPTTDSILQNVFLYDSNNTENFVESLHNLPQNNKYQLLSSYTSISNSLTLFKTSSSEKFCAATLFFRLREVHAKNCISAENIFYTLNSTFQMTASANGPCIVTILQVNISSATNLELSHLKTDSLENVKFVAGVDPKFPFFEFNSKTASSWTKLYFYGVSNSFIIPNGSTLKFKATLRLDFLSDGYADNNVKKGIISSKIFASPWDKPKNTFDLYIKNDTICFMTVKFLDLSTTAFLNVSVKRFLKSDIPVPIITHVNQTFNFTTVNYPDNIQVTLIHEEHEIGHRGYLIEFEMIPSKAAHRIFSLCYWFLFIIVICNN